MDARTSRNQKRLSRMQEERIAKDVGGRTQPASGALHGAKGDVRVFGRLRVEAKFTHAVRYTLKREHLEKIIEEAGLEDAVLQICFLDKRTNRPMNVFAIFPCDPAMPGRPEETRWAEWQTYGKSVIIVRDSAAIKLLKHHGPIWYVFSSRADGKDTHQWFELLEWSEYLARREQKHA